MPASSGHHHRPPKIRKLWGKATRALPTASKPAGKPAGKEPAGKPAGAHEYTWQRNGWASCSCGAWTRTGAETTTTIEHRQHVAEANRP
jgi:hypothetical protein